MLIVKIVARKLQLPFLKTLISPGSPANIESTTKNVMIMVS
jgi:hypothetical protein